MENKYIENILALLESYKENSKIQYNDLNLLIQKVKVGNSDPRYIKLQISNIKYINDSHIGTIINYLDEAIKIIDKQENKEEKKEKEDTSLKEEKKENLEEYEDLEDL